MSLKQSCYKAVLKSDFKRMWWVGVAATVFMFMTFTSSYLQYSRYNYHDEYFISEFASLVVIGFPVAFVLGLLVFNYLNSASSVSFTHSLPVKRLTLMASHVTFAVITILVPAIINYAICLSSVEQGLNPLLVLKAFGVYTVLTLLIFSLSMLIGLLCGNSVAGGIFTLVVIYLPAFVSAFIEAVSNRYFFGYYDYTYNLDSEHWLFKYVYLDFDSLLTAKVLIYIGLIVASLLLSAFVYKKRHLENHGEIIAFTSLNGLFKVLFGLCFGILGYFWSAGMWGYESIMTMFVFVPLGVIIANMLSNKSFTFKKLYRPLLISLIIVIAFFAVFQFDLFGYETKQPELSEVESITYLEGYNKYDYLESVDGGDWKSVIRPKPVIDDKETLQKLHDFHKKLISKRYDYRDGIYYANVIFEYNLKNGKSFLREYDLSESEYTEYSKIVFGTDAAMYWRYPILDESRDITYKSASVTDMRINTYLGEVVSSEHILQLVEALRKDKANISYEEYNEKARGDCIRIELYYSGILEIDGKKYIENNSDYYVIDQRDVNTVEVLEKIGLLKDVTKPLKLIHTYG